MECKVDQNWTVPLSRHYLELCSDHYYHSERNCDPLNKLAILASTVTYNFFLPKGGFFSINLKLLQSFTVLETYFKQSHCMTQLFCFCLTYNSWWEAGELLLSITLFIVSHISHSYILYLKT